MGRLQDEEMETTGQCFYVHLIKHLQFLGLLCRSFKRHGCNLCTWMRMYVLSLMNELRKIIYYAL